MSLTLGQKLKQAREEQGIPVSEVAEQTRIAPLYIESIDNDDYRSLPGGIFNRGFVKSYAKYVGVDEHEALADYARLLNDTEGNDVEEVKTYRPQVLTDDHLQSSMLPTLIVAAIVLGVMIGGILFFVKYLRGSAENDAVTATTKSFVNAVVANIAQENQTPAKTPSPTPPDSATVKVEFRAVNQPVSLTATVDDATSITQIAAGSTKLFEPKTSLKLSYSRSRAAFAELTINGKPITLPTAPTDQKRPGLIDFEINKDNLERIWSSGTIPTASTTTGTSAASIVNTESPSASPRPKPTPEKPKPTTNNTPAPSRPANSPARPPRPTPR